MVRKAKATGDLAVMRAWIRLKVKLLLSVCIVAPALSPGSACTGVCSRIA
jgi:hypothetical protein